MMAPRDAGGRRRGSMRHPGTGRGDGGGARTVMALGQRTAMMTRERKGTVGQSAAAGVTCSGEKGGGGEWERG